MSHLAKDPNLISLRCLNTYSMMPWKSLNPSEQLWKFHETQGIIYNIGVSEITMTTALLHSSVLNKVAAVLPPLRASRTPVRWSSLVILPPFFDPLELGSSSVPSSPPTSSCP